ncbi:hypothetical protein [Novacetimonas pomaceti]|uniref:hypothetical protein n=1 Tax=Novacetimonas pomaceti TaxID=2021998 RepID=UPI001057E79A|nr:hypothetical protein [Novacetimonas pomaceti]
MSPHHERRNVLCERGSADIPALNPVTDRRFLSAVRYYLSASGIQESHREPSVFPVAITSPDDRIAPEYSAETTKTVRKFLVKLFSKSFERTPPF